MTRVLFLVLLALPVPPSGSARAAQVEEPRGLRMIVVGSETEASSLRARIVAGASFEALAREHANGASNGYFGRVRASDLGEALRMAIDGLAHGEVSEVVALGGEYALLGWLTDEEESWREQNDAGIDLFTTGRFAEARRFFREAVDLARGFGNEDVRLADSLANLATAYLRDGLYERAEPHFREVLAVLGRTRPPDHPDLIRPLSDLAGTLYRLDEVDEAQTLFARVLPLAEAAFGPVHAGTSTALNNLALVLRDRDLYADAEPLFLRAIAILEALDGPDDPAVSLVLDDLAESYRREGRLAEADAAASRSVRISEAFWGADHAATAPPLSALARVRIDQERYDEAIDLETRALGIRWSNDGGAADGGAVAAILDTFADAFLAARFRDEQARREFEALEVRIEGGPVREDLYRAMSDTFLDVAFRSEAERVMLAAVERFGSPGARYQLAETYARSLLPERAFETFESVVPAFAAENAYRLRRMGDMLTFLFRQDEALAAYDAALDADPGNVDVYLALGNLRFERNEHELAAEAYMRAVEVEPGDASAHSRLGEVFLLLGRTEEALQAVGSALDLDDSNAQTHYVQAQALLRGGDIERGETVLARYQELAAEKAAGEHRTREIAAYDNEVSAALSRDEYARAVETLRAAIAEFPESGLMHLNLGLVLSRLADYGGAVDALEGRLALGIENDFAAYRAFSIVAAEQGDDTRRLRNRALFLGAIGPAFEDALE